MSRDQINRYFKLGTIRNTNRILKGLSDYLSVVRDGFTSVYYLNSNGREYVDCQKVRKKGGHINHVIMRNDAWFHFKCPHDWQNEVKITSISTSIVADAVFTQNGFHHFLEVDHTQTMKENRLKIERYKSLSESILNKYGYYPTLVWLTTTKHRKEQLENACNGLKVKVLTIDDIK